MRWPWVSRPDPRTPRRRCSGRRQRGRTGQGWSFLFAVYEYRSRRLKPSWQTIKFNEAQGLRPSSWYSRDDPAKQVASLGRRESRVVRVGFATCGWRPGSGRSIRPSRSGMPCAGRSRLPPQGSAMRSTPGPPPAGRTGRSLRRWFSGLLAAVRRTRSPAIVRVAGGRACCPGWGQGRSGTRRPPWPPTSSAASRGSRSRTTVSATLKLGRCRRVARS